jgi:carboxymethylenebutenolidase
MPGNKDNLNKLSNYMTIKNGFVSLITSDARTMQAYFAEPFNPEGKSLPGLLVFQEAFGVNKHIRDVVHRFAEHGFIAIAPELFHRTAAPGFEGSYTDFAALAPHMQAVNEQGMEADVRASWDWLQQHTHLRKDHIACTGYCMGGRVSFLANAILPVKAAVSYYGGRIAPDLIKRTPDLHAPMLFFWGGLDKHIPQEQIHAVTSALSAANKPFTNVEISYADHGFSCDERASFNKQASNEAWALTLAFLKEKLN